MNFLFLLRLLFLAQTLSILKYSRCLGETSVDLECLIDFPPAEVGVTAVVVETSQQLLALPAAAAKLFLTGGWPAGVPMRGSLPALPHLGVSCDAVVASSFTLTVTAAPEVASIDKGKLTKAINYYSVQADFFLCPHFSGGV